MMGVDWLLQFVVNREVIGQAGEDLSLQIV